MEKNYTPVNVQNFKNNKQTNSIFIAIAVVTASVLAAMLMILIQKKQEQSRQAPAQVSQPAISPTPVATSGATITPAKQIK